MRSRRSGPRTDSDFLKLWAGQKVSMFGAQITAVALPFTAALHLGATPGQMGVLVAAGWRSSTTPAPARSCSRPPFFLRGLGLTGWTIQIASLQQTLVAGRLLGRMNAAYLLLSLGAGAVGALAGGTLGGVVGLRPTVIAAAAGLSLAWLWLALSPLPRVRSLADLRSRRDKAARAPERRPGARLPYENRHSVRERYVAPGSRTTDGKSGPVRRVRRVLGLQRDAVALAVGRPPGPTSVASRKLPE
jgi:hypothetical protein